MQYVNKNTHFKRVVLTGTSSLLGHIILARLLKDYSCDVVVLLITGTNIHVNIVSAHDQFPFKFMSIKEKCFLILFSQISIWSNFYGVFKQHKINRVKALGIDIIFTDEWSK